MNESNNGASRTEPRLVDLVYDGVIAQAIERAPSFAPHEVHTQLFLDEKGRLEDARLCDEFSGRGSTRSIPPWKSYRRGFRRQCLGENGPHEKLDTNSMTDLSFPWEVGPPWLYIGFGEEERAKWIPSHFYSKEGVQTVVRMLRGWKMRTVQGLMDEFAAALQFFDGFGENWGALEDCLMWMDEWLPAEAYVLVVERSEELLADEPGALGDFLATIQTVGESWSEPVELPCQFRRDARPFHLLLNVSKGKSEAIARLVEAAEHSGTDYRQG